MSPHRQSFSLTRRQYRLTSFYAERETELADWRRRGRTHIKSRELTIYIATPALGPWLTSLPRPLGLVDRLNAGNGSDVCKVGL